MINTDMSYRESVSEEFFHFTKQEEEVIESFLKEKGYTIGHNSVCGGCCGMYSDLFYVNGIGGKWKNQKDRTDLHNLLKEMGCEHSIYGYHIDADPNGGEYYEDRLSYKKT